MGSSPNCRPGSIPQHCGCWGPTTAIPRLRWLPVTISGKILEDQRKRGCSQLFRSSWILFESFNFCSINLLNFYDLSWGRKLQSPVSSCILELATYLLQKNSKRRKLLLREILFVFRDFKCHSKALLMGPGRQVIPCRLLASHRS